MTQAETSHSYETVDCLNCGEPANAQWGEIHADGQLIKKWLIHLDCSGSCWERDPNGAEEAANELERRHRIPPVQ